MKISRKAWNEYIAKLARCDKAAADAMWTFMRVNGIDDIDALIQYGYSVATRYGEASAAIAAEMYDATAELAKASVPAAIPAETASFGEVRAAVTGAAEYSNEKTIASTVSRLVKQAGADTTIQNAIRDSAQWAWIPSGDTCAFCIMLASNGWQYASKKVLKGNHASHIHANCDCAFAVRFDEKSSYGSYNPDKYAAIYNNAEGSKWQDKLNAMRRENYKVNKDEINEQKRIAYAARKERKNGKFTNNGKDGIINSDVLTHRKTGENGREIINKAVYSKITGSAIKKGAEVVTATSENGLLRYLDERGATAVTLDNVIILREDATTTEVLEEAYHFNQNRRGLNKQYGTLQRTIMNEIDAQEYLISVADKYKIPTAETEETEAILDSYKRQREELKKAGEWDDNS